MRGIVSVAAAAAVIGLAVGGATGQPKLIVPDGVTVIGDLSRGGPGGADEHGPKPIPLVNADEEMAGYVRRAQEMISKGGYPGAIEILQALLNRPQQCFVCSEDGRLYVSLAAAASRVVGELPPDGLKLYRRLYDAEADELLRRARADLDEAGLRDVVRRYFHTSAGDQALNLLGAILFDRGRFSQAARCWRDIVLRYRGSDLEAAGLLVKIAVAHHFAGEGRRAAEALDKLRAEHADARCRLGGKTQPAVAYTQKVLSAPSPRPVAAAAASDWTSLAGAPDGVAVMGPCRNPTLKARWTRPEGSIQGNPNVASLAAWLGRQGPSRTGLLDSGIRLREGHLVSTVRLGSQKGQNTLPATIHPVVVNSTVIFRDMEAVAAYDLFTGEKLWDTERAGQPEFPLYQRVETGSARFVSFGAVPAASFAEDRGYCTLTAGGGKVFALGQFNPIAQAIFRRGVPLAQAPRNSVLAAFSLAAEGKLIWSSDEPGRPEMLRQCRLISAPTYSAGRLYVVGVHTQTYYLFCLDAETGRMLWPEPVFVSQVPISVGAMGRFVPMGVNDRGSGPAVADGRVYVCTNAGAVAAFDADTGRGLWAYQYDSNLNQAASAKRMPRGWQASMSVGYPPNPVIVTRGRVIFLPADSAELLALRADTGEPAWQQQVDRGGQRDLTAVDEYRILLSGPGLSILDVSDGEELWSSAHSMRKISDIHGRPAVTPESILASGQGEVVVVSLRDHVVTSLPLVDGRDSLLGNLVCVEGKLLAANAAGVSAYLSFEDGQRELTQRIRRASPKALANLYYLRGMNAFNAGRPEQALTDLLRARTSARGGGQTALMERTSQALYRTYVSIANGSGDNVRMGALFRKAQACAYSDRSRAEMQLRMAKYQQRVGRYAQAAAGAQKLATYHAETDIKDVAIGPQADPYVRDDQDTPRFSGSHLGHKFIKALIDAHGQGCYAAFDAKAKVALASAIAADDADAMARVVSIYTHSTYAPMALLRAGESLYRKARASQKQARAELLARAAQHLGRVGQEYPGSGLAPSAALGLAMVYQQMNPRIMWLGLQGLSGVPAGTRVSFAGVSGSLGAVLRRLKFNVPLRVAEPVLGAIQPPLVKLYELGAEALVIRNAAGQPVRLGQSVFVLEGGRLSLFDPSADSFEAGKRWEAPLGVDMARIYGRGFAAWAAGMIGGLSSDGSIFVLAGRGGIFGVATRTGKQRWRYEVGEPVVARLNWMALGGNWLAVLGVGGQVTAMDVRTGKRVLSRKLPGQAWRAAPQIGGGLLAVAHGTRNVQLSVFDLNRGVLLGTLDLSRSAQVHLTADGLLLVCDGGSLRMIEPVLGIDRDIWSVALLKSSYPSIVGATHAQVIVSPSSRSGLIELRSLADSGRIVRTFQTRAIRGSVAAPSWARIAGGRLYVITRQAHAGLAQVLDGRLRYTRVPSLQAFDLASGELLWATELSVGGQVNVFLMLPQICRGHVGIVVKQHVTQPLTVMIIDSRSGRVVQKVEVPAAVQAGRAAFTRLRSRHFWLGGPAISNGRMILETYKALRVYGKKGSGKQE